ncbi:sugar transferase [Limnoglobus roseus]|uniref:Putative glycosyltransferase n=1 Tax=Limnoglobus roseus TaxID=2598579 RepID=A0A5C1AI73_9BACT|nr:sugar transferase [Limnoglobus roseus]QEL16834.1 putative glycosyltransferase [Limnoglobus roseus]
MNQYRDTATVSLVGRTESLGATDLPRKGPLARLKRALVYVPTVFLIVLTAPVTLLAVVLVKLTSPGPAFYTQVRLGRNGVPFRIYKIRTMHVDCERDTGPVWATRYDPRAFRVGRILRVLHLDELPQLMNVLRGDMAFVGPRPERPMIAAQLQESIPGYQDRLCVRPGLTGLAQVQFPGDQDLGSVCQKLFADLLYIRAAGPVLDLRILIATVFYLLHLPLSWRLRTLGSIAERSHLIDPTPGSTWDSLAAVYRIPQKPDRILAVQGLRGVAASLVFLAHFLTLFGVYLGSAAGGLAAQAVDTMARHGTDLFLMISGYLIYGMCVRRQLDYGRFLNDRFWRIYPTFLCVFGLYLGLSLAFPGESKVPAEPAAAVAYLLENLALLPGLTGTPPLIVVTWTLGYELLLYVTLPLAIHLTGMRNWTSPQRVAVLAAVWGCYLVYCVTLSPAHARFAVYIAAFLAYEFVRGRRGRLSAGGEAVAMTAVAAGVGGAVLLRAGIVSSPDLPGMAVGFRVVAVSAAVMGVAYCCFGGDGRCSRAFSWSPLRWLGNMSYSFYLTHGLVLKALALAATVLVPAEFRGPWLFWAALPVCYFGAVATSTALFVGVEKRLSFSLRSDPAVPHDDRTCPDVTVDPADTVLDIDASQRTARMTEGNPAFR